MAIVNHTQVEMMASDSSIYGPGKLNGATQMLLHQTALDVHLDPNTLVSGEHIGFR